MSTPHYYLGVVRALEPIMIRSRRTPRGYESLSDVLPASSLAAALARGLGLGGGLELLSRGYAVSDAYPVYIRRGDYVPTIPSTPTTYKIKNIGGIGSSLPRAFFCLTTPGNETRVYRRVYEHVERKIKFKPSGLLKNVKTGSPVAIEGDKSEDDVPCVAARVVEVRAEHSYDSVAINPGRGSAEEEMLFTYYAIPAGTCFWFTAAIPGEVSEESLETRIGGRTSAGYGRAHVIIERIGDDVVERIEEHYSGDEAYMYLWSPSPSLALTGLSRPGWSRASGRPRLAVPLLPAGSVIERRRAGERIGVVEARFRGIAPPYGQAEPVRSDDAVPYTFTLFSQRISELCRRLENLV